MPARRTPVLLLSLALLAANPAHAGIMDSIKGLFSGGKDKVSGLFGGDDKQVTELLEKLNQSQKDVAEKQQALVDSYNGGKAKADDPALQQKLDDLKAASGTNEQLYLKFLQFRADLAKSGNEKALAPLTEQIAKITSTQNQLESNYQRIQETNKGAGFFTPTGESAASETVAEGGASTDGPIWEKPDAQRYIDEWLSKAHLNEWGQWVGTTATATVVSAGSPDTAIGATSRHHAVWRLMHDKSANTNYTLEEYVQARMNGESPQVAYTPPADSAPSQTVAASSTQVQPSAITPAASVTQPAETPAASGTSTPARSLADIDADLKTDYEAFARLQKEGLGSSDQAKSLLTQIEALQKAKASAISNK